MNQIKAIITDVDGVMVGAKQGVNFPLPGAKVIDALQRIATSGIPIVLCTAKFGPAIKQIALKANLANPHITDGGAILIDWVNGTVAAQHTLDSVVVENYVQRCLEQDIYTELYTANSYFIQVSQASDFSAKRSQVLQVEPVIVPSLYEIATKETIIKMVSFSKDSEDKATLEATAEEQAGKLSYVWSYHPFLVPRWPLILTAPGVSKQQAAQEVTISLGIPFENILGIGDSEADWNFMQLCGHVAAVTSDSNGYLTDFITERGDHGYIAPGVGEDGLLALFDHFDL